MNAASRPIDLYRPGALDGAIVASRRLPYIYVQNWKCGCSTVKTTLWAAEHAVGTARPPRHPHQRIADYPFVNDSRRWANVGREFVFTFVRNPYARMLSAYLNKLVHRRDPSVWGRFAARHGLDESPLPFVDFLRLVAATPPGRMDMHWRPQSHTVAPNAVPYDFIGSMEDFEGGLREVLSRIFGRELPVREHAPHRTGSVEQLVQYYGPEEIDLVRAICAIDFQAFGYSTDPANLARKATKPSIDLAAMRAWGKGCRLYEEGQFAAAAAELEKARGSLGGPVYTAKLLECHCETLARGDPDEVTNSARYVAAALARGHGDAETWKRYGKALVARGRREEGLTALIRSVRMRSSGAGTRRRLRRLAGELAMVRAVEGRRAEALAALAEPAEAPAGSWFAEFPTTMVDTVQRLLIYVVATAASTIGPASRRVEAPRPPG